MMFKSFEEYEKLEKALVAGAGTDIAKLSGGQAIQRQSLEKKTASLVLPFFLESIVNGHVENTHHAYKSYLKNKGLSDKVSKELIMLVAKNVDKIANVVL